MPATLTVRNYRSIADAVIPLPFGPGELLFLTGPNAAGKSTLCSAAACALLRDPSVLGQTKPDRGPQLRKGAKTGTIQLSDDGGMWSTSIPAGEASEQGAAADLPMASAVACGLIKPAALPAKERAAAMISLIRAMPTQKEWLAAMSEAGLSDRATATWADIEKDGWDGAAKRWATDATQGKGAWREVTGGQTWGKNAAQGWQPAGFDDDDLASMTVEQARAAYAQAKAHRDEVLRAQAVAGRDQTRIDELEERILRHAQDRDTAARDVTERKKALDEAEAALAAAPERTPDICTCPHCKADVEIVSRDGGGYALRQPIERAKGTVDREGLRKAVQHAKAAFDGASSRHTARLRDIEICTDERDRLAARPEAAAQDPQAAAAAELELTNAEALGKAVAATHRASDIHANILAGIAMAELAGATGLRKKKMAKALGLINGSMAERSEAMGCPVVQITPDVDVTMGDRPYHLLSQSERWRVDAIIAVELATRDASEIVVLDGADVLDQRGRNGLLTMLQQSGCATIVAMTMARSMASKLAQAGVPVAVVDGGRVEFLAGETVREAV